PASSSRRCSHSLPGEAIRIIPEPRPPGSGFSRGHPRWCRGRTGSMICRMDEHTNTVTEPVGPGPPVRRRLTRPADHRVIGGVAAGLGEYFDVDPILFRVGFVVAAFIGGLGILVYLVLWWFTPPSNVPYRAAWREPRGEQLMQRLKSSP